MDKVLAFIPVMLLLFAPASNAQDSSCYMEDENGNPIDLGSLCGQSSDYVIPSDRSIVDFPDYVFNSSIAKPEATRHLDLVDGYRWSTVYENRYIYSVSKYPFTEQAFNEYETAWIDCYRGWTYILNLPLVTERGMTHHLFGPSVGAQYFSYAGIEASGATQELKDTSRDYCQAFNLSTGF